MRKKVCLFIVGFTVFAGCGGEKFINVPCTPQQPSPYPDGIPYTGIHAGSSNNDLVECNIHNRFKLAWHSLKGHAIPQPNTFSPDGSVTYVTASPSPDSSCTVYAISVEDGSVIWCREYSPRVMGSSVEVDEDGNLYFTDGITVISLDPDGNERWRSSVPVTAGVQVAQDNAIGLHFTPGGHIATVTNSGVVALLSRSSGKVLAVFSIPQEFGFVPLAGINPEVGGDFTLLDFLPQEVQLKLFNFFGGEEGTTNFMDWFFGSSGGYTDNTLAVSSRGDIFVIGGGPDDTHGALIQIKIQGTPENPSLTRGWYTVINYGSATSPSVSPDGRFVNFGDGSNYLALLFPQAVSAYLYTVDVDACDSNTDADPAPDICAPVWKAKLIKGPLAGSVPILPDGGAYVWESGFSSNINDPDPDIRYFDSSGNLVWEVALRDGMTWSSVITVADNYLVGTASVIVPSEHYIFSIPLPETVSNYLILLDRQDGSEVLRVPVSDDAASTVTVGPDGSLYVNMLGLYSLFAINHDVMLGIARYRPVQ